MCFLLSVLSLLGLTDSGHTFFFLKRQKNATRKEHHRAKSLTFCMSKNVYICLKMAGVIGRT